MDELLTFLVESRFLIKRSKRDSYPTKWKISMSVLSDFVVKLLEVTKDGLLPVSRIRECVEREKLEMELTSIGCQGDIIKILAADSRLVYDTSNNAFTLSIPKIVEPLSDAVERWKKYVQREVLKGPLRMSTIVEKSMANKTYLKYGHYSAELFAAAIVTEMRLDSDFFFDDTCKSFVTKKIGYEPITLLFAAGNDSWSMLEGRKKRKPASSWTTDSNCHLTDVVIPYWKNSVLSSSSHICIRRIFHEEGERNEFAFLGFCSPVDLTVSIFETLAADSDLICDRVTCTLMPKSSPHSASCVSAVAGFSHFVTFQQEVDALKAYARTTKEHEGKKPVIPISWIQLPAAVRQTHVKHGFALVSAFVAALRCKLEHAITFYDDVLPYVIARPAAEAGKTAPLARGTAGDKPAASPCVAPSTVSPATLKSPIEERFAPLYATGLVSDDPSCRADLNGAPLERRSMHCKLCGMYNHSNRYCFLATSQGLLSLSTLASLREDNVTSRVKAIHKSGILAGLSDSLVKLMLERVKQLRAHVTPATASSSSGSASSATLPAKVEAPQAVVPTSSRMATATSPVAAGCSGVIPANAIEWWRCVLDSKLEQGPVSVPDMRSWACCENALIDAAKASGFLSVEHYLGTVLEELLKDSTLNLDVKRKELTSAPSLPAPAVGMVDAASDSDESGPEEVKAIPPAIVMAWEKSLLKEVAAVGAVSYSRIEEHAAGSSYHAKLGFASPREFACALVEELCKKSEQLHYNSALCYFVSGCTTEGTPRIENEREGGVAVAEKVSSERGVAGVETAVDVNEQEWRADAILEDAPPSIALPEAPLASLSSDSSDNASESHIDVFAPAASDVFAPAASDVSVPAASDVSVPAASDVSAPAALDVSASAALDVAVLPNGLPSNARSAQQDSADANLSAATVALPIVLSFSHAVTAERVDETTINQLEEPPVPTAAVEGWKKFIRRVTTDATALPVREMVDRAAANKVYLNSGFSSAEAFVAAIVEELRKDPTLCYDEDCQGFRVMVAAPSQCTLANAKAAVTTAVAVAVAPLFEEVHVQESTILEANAAPLDDATSAPPLSGTTPLGTAPTEDVAETDSPDAPTGAAAHHLSKHKKRLLGRRGKGLLAQEAAKAKAAALTSDYVNVTGGAGPAKDPSLLLPETVAKKPLSFKGVVGEWVHVAHRDSALPVYSIYQGAQLPETYTSCGFASADEMVTAVVAALKLDKSLRYEPEEARFKAVSWSVPDSDGDDNELLQEPADVPINDSAMAGPTCAADPAASPVLIAAGKRERRITRRKEREEKKAEAAANAEWQQLADSIELMSRAILAESAQDDNLQLAETAGMTAGSFDIRDLDLAAALEEGLFGEGDAEQALPGLPNGLLSADPFVSSALFSKWMFGSVRSNDVDHIAVGEVPRTPLAEWLLTQQKAAGTQQQMAAHPANEYGLLGLQEGGDHNGAAECFISISEPFSILVAGAPGSGKTHTAKCILEACLLPSKELSIIRRRQSSFTALALFYRRNLNLLCELVSMSTLANADFKEVVPPLNKMAVFVSPGYHSIRKVQYERTGVRIVRPFLVAWSQVTVQQVMRMFQLQSCSSDDPLYAAVRALLRANTPASITFAQFTSEIMSRSELHASSKSKTGIMEGLQLLALIVAESDVSQAQFSNRAHREYAPVADGLTVLDLSDPLLQPKEAALLFEFATLHFTSLEPARAPSRKLLVLEDAQQYLNASAGFSAALVDIAHSLHKRNHTDLLICSQQPNEVPMEVIEAVDLAVIHRQHASQKPWLQGLARQPTEEEWQEMLCLERGASCLYTRKVPVSTKPIVDEVCEGETSSEHSSVMMSSRDMRKKMAPLQVVRIRNTITK